MEEEPSVAERLRRGVTLKELLRNPALMVGEDNVEELLESVVKTIHPESFNKAMASEYLSLSKDGVVKSTRPRYVTTAVLLMYQGQMFLVKQVRV
jgi:hypothetical protein